MLDLFDFCTLDAVGLYPNIAHEESLDKHENQATSVEYLFIFTYQAYALKNKIFKYKTRCFQQLKGIATRTKFVQQYVTLFIFVLERTFFNPLVDKTLIWGRHIDHIFMICQHRDRNLKII